MVATDRLGSDRWRGAISTAFRSRRILAASAAPSQASMPECQALTAMQGSNA